MKVLWLSWKDIYHPLGGGAEVVTDSLLSKLAVDGHDVTLLTATYPHAKHIDSIHGYNVIRTGGRLTVYWYAYKYYKNHLENENFDIVIEEINTIPFFSKFYIRKSANTQHFAFFHMLAREIWFYEMVFPISLVGYILEPIYLWLLRDMSVITVSLSTRDDVMRFGFQKHNISIISEGVHVAPVANLDTTEKYPDPTVMTIGRVTSMKRVHHIIKAFEYAKERIPTMKLIIAGGMNTPYAEKVASYVKRSPFTSDITILGKVTEEQKREIMERSHMIAVTSVKEGWGLIVTEAGMCGTPAVVYNVDGLRDSVQDGRTGLISRENTPRSLSLSMTELLSNVEYYKSIRKNAWQFAQTITFDQQYQDFKEVVGLSPKKSTFSTLVF